ncbi:MAG: sugar phosphate isomerase/epimerase [Gemmatimonadaceae bacterium]|nr:sugar phosphate isomerase/epimerase [Gemmatimonadaceae bacterium]
MDRRQFMLTSAAAAAAGSLSRLDGHLVPAPTRLRNVGLGLFSVPKMLEADFRGTIAMLAGMGYREVELFGPYAFSEQAAIDAWAKIIPQVGFAGSGFFGMTGRQVRAILDEHHMKAPSAHTDWFTLQRGMGRLAEAAHDVGYEYVVLPSIPDELRQDLDAYRRMADAMNAVGAEAKRNGLKFAYHNHGYGLTPMDGQVPLQLLLERTDPSLVYLEMDVYWTAAGGADPVELLRAHPGRYTMLHLKDMKERKRFRGNGGNSGEWVELFPYMTTAGDGVLDLRSIVAQARRSGVAHYFVEQDVVANPDVALKRSYDFIAGL